MRGAKEALTATEALPPNRGRRDDAFDPDGVVFARNRYDLVPHNGEPGMVADVWAKLIVRRPVANPSEGHSNLANEADGGNGA